MLSRKGRICKGSGVTCTYSVHLPVSLCLSQPWAPLGLPSHRGPTRPQCCQLLARGSALAERVGSRSRAAAT